MYGCGGTLRLFVIQISLGLRRFSARLSAMGKTAAAFAG
jgi:hypothetical protein